MYNSLLLVLTRIHAVNNSCIRVGRSGLGCGALCGGEITSAVSDGCTEVISRLHPSRNIQVSWPYFARMHLPNLYMMYMYLRVTSAPNPQEIGRCILSLAASEGTSDTLRAERCLSLYLLHWIIGTRAYSYTVSDKCCVHPKSTGPIHSAQLSAMHT